jgi:hypothetical protein
LDSCACGVARRKFWIWRDGNEALHASAFPPSNGVVQTMIAATARDALVAAESIRAPKHQVHDADTSLQIWDGRCQEAAVAAVAG